MQFNMPQLTTPQAPMPGPDWQYIQNMNALKQQQVNANAQREYQNAMMQLMNPTYGPPQPQEQVSPQITKLREAVGVPSDTGSGTESDVEKAVERPVTFKAQNFAQLKAQEDFTASMMKRVAPLIDTAVSSGNQKLFDEVSSKLKNSGVSQLEQYGDMLSKVDVLGPNKTAWEFDFSNKEVRNNFFNKHRDALEKLGVEGPDSINGRVKVSFNNGRITDVSTVKMPGVKTKTVVRMVGDKPHTILVDALSGEDIKDLGEAKAGGAGGGFGLKGFIQHKTIPGAFFNRADGKTYMDIPDGQGGTKRVSLDSMSVQEQSRYWPAEIQKVKQRGGAKAVNAYVVADTYKAEAAELKALRDKIMQDNPGAFSGVGSKIRKMNRISQLAQLETGDNPDLAEFIKGTTLLADVLQNAVGGAQGGQWAFELASKLLDPSMPPEAYNATIDKHMRTLETKAKFFAGAGAPGTAGYQERPKVPGEYIKDDIRVGGTYKSKKILRTGKDNKGNIYVQLGGVKDPVRVK